MEIPSVIRVDTSIAGLTVLELVGEHDLASADKLAAALAEALACGGGIIVDFSETTFADSTGSICSAGRSGGSASAAVSWSCKSRLAASFSEPLRSLV